MSGPLGAAALVLLAYLIGAIPFGMLAGRLAGGIDLRRHGSQRTGATNALRTLGLRWAAAVFLLDVGKGVAAVLLARALYVAGPPGSPEWVLAACGVAAVIGHNWSVFIGFGGGRGVATSAGGLLAISPLTLALVVPLVALVVWRTRFVSLGSLVAAIAAPLITAALAATSVVGWAALGYALATGVLIVVSHGDNVARLRSGTERRIGEREVVGSDGRG
ncbi:MAG TPA: glycerol-3-phosphate 1-O-acyltransferase PlsY [Candidatus Limnocylindrales bacterium]|nr:glycerol-3-phosphate 1-O-acyltransferase PlsY [Candidatus Limnocylindrales bacterium]